MKKIILLPIILLLLATISYADMGPKPNADFQVTMNGQKITDSSFSSAMMTCKNTTDSSPRGHAPDLYINQYDPERSCYWNPDFLAWGGKCSNSACNHNYFLPEKFRFGVYLPSQNKVYLSPEVTRNNFNSYFKADLKTDGTIDLIETTPFFASAIFKIIILFLISLALTTGIELLVALIFISAWKISKSLLKFIVFANLITLVILWVAMLTIESRYSFLVFIVGEVLIMIFEGYFIYHFNKSIITYKRSAIMSIVMNLASLFLGGLILAFFALFFYIAI